MVRLLRSVSLTLVLTVLSNRKDALMEVRLLFVWSNWLIGVDWSDRILRSALKGWMVHFRLGPVILQVRSARTG